MRLIAGIAAYAIACLAGAMYALAPTRAGAAVVLGLIGASLALLIAATFALVTYRYRQLVALVTEKSLQTDALINVRPLGGVMPLQLSDWAIEPDLAQILSRLVIERRPSVVVECGSGTSTILLAQCLKELGHGRVYSLDHDEHFAGKTRQALADRRLTPFADIIYAPLTPTTLEQQSDWYDQRSLETLPDDIDLLIVDGPPALEARARYPAYPLLASKMAKDSVVVLDDGAREGETWIAQRWCADYGLLAEYSPHGHGTWILHTGKFAR